MECLRILAEMGGTTSIRHILIAGMVEADRLHNHSDPSNNTPGFLPGDVLEVYARNIGHGSMDHNIVKATRHGHDTPAHFEPIREYMD